MLTTILLLLLLWFFCAAVFIAIILNILFVFLPKKNQTLSDYKTHEVY